MTDKYLSIITNFGCHYSCPECIVRNNKLKMTPTDENSSWDNLSRTLGENPDMNWVSVSGGGDPLFHWWEHQFWWLGLFTVCSSARRHLELHTSYLPTTDSKMFVLFPYSMFDRIVYHVHNINELKKVTRACDEIVRVVFVVDDSMTEDDINAEFEKAGVKDVEASKAEFIADGRMPAVRESIRRSKAVDHLVENAKVTEVDETAKDAE